MKRVDVVHALIEGFDMTVCGIQCSAWGCQVVEAAFDAIRSGDGNWSPDCCCKNCIRALDSRRRQQGVGQ